MKKFLIFVLVVILAIGGFFGYKKISAKIREDNRIKEAKKGWYLEVLVDELNVREDPIRTSDKIAEIYKGEIYEITDYNLKDSTKYWYQIKLKDGSFGWVANTKNGNYIKDYNGNIDVATPTLKFVNTYKTNEQLSSPDAYKALDIDHITTDHLTVWDDRDDWKITWEIYHEVKPSEHKDQYWIVWTVTDASGKYASKTQRIVFENKPSEDQVKDFYKEYKK